MGLRFPICKMAMKTELLRGWHDFIHVRHLEQCLARRKCSVSVSWYQYYYKWKSRRSPRVTCNLKNDKMYTHEISGSWLTSQRAVSLPAKLKIPATPIQRRQKDPGQLYLHQGRFWRSLANGPIFAFVILTWQAEEFLEDSRVWVQVTPGCHLDWPGIPSCHLLPTPQNRAPSGTCCCWLNLWWVRPYFTREVTWLWERAQTLESEMLYINTNSMLGTE